MPRGSLLGFHAGVFAMLSALLLAQAPCPRGWDTLEGNACLLRGEGPGLLVYFHGMLAPDVQAFGRELQLLAAPAREKRLPVLALRGTPGLCDWAPEYRTWWCWPSARARLPEVAATALRVDTALAAAARALGRALPAPVFAGYSNGGYFLSLLMGLTSLRASGFAVLHAGAVVGAQFPAERRAPTLLLAAAEDKVQRPGMEALRATLEREGWAPRWSLRQGTHPLVADDFAQVAAFAAGLAAAGSTPAAPAR